MKKLLLSLLFLCVLPGAAHAAITDNVQGSWKLDEASGDAADASPNGYTLTNSSVTYSSSSGCKINNAGVFSSGSTAHLSIPSASAPNLSISGTGSITMAAWIYITSTPATVEVGLINKFGTGGNAQNGYTLTLDTSDFINVFTDNSTDVRLRGYAATALSLNTCYFVVGIVNPTVPSILIYINGVSQSITYYDQNSISINSNSQPFTLGCWTNGGSFTRCFDGVIDTPTVLNRAWSAAEVTQAYNGGAGLQYPFAPAAVASAVRAFIFNAFWLR